VAQVHVVERRPRDRHRGHGDAVGVERGEHRGHRPGAVLGARADRAALDRDLADAREPLEAASLSPGAVTTVLDRLERMELVTRTRDEADRRRVLVEITPKARELTRSMYGPIAGYAREYLDSLTDEELEVINRFLEVATEINERRAREVGGLETGTP
jgi:DNA-binding MarR family transcriptional regulator